MIRERSSALARRGESAGSPSDTLFLRGFAGLFTQLGGTAERLAAMLAGASSSPDAAEVDGYARGIAMLEAAAAATRCPDFGMRLALAQDTAAMLAEAGETLNGIAAFGEAIQLFTARHYLPSHTAFLWTKHYAASDPLAVADRGDGLLDGHAPSAFAQVALGVALLADGPIIRAQAIETILLTLCRLAAALTGGRLRARHVLFRHQPLAPRAAYLRNFGCDVSFGQRADAMVYREEDFARPLAMPEYACAVDAAPDAADRPAAPASSVRARARVTVNHFLHTPYCTRDRVARHLDLHPRTMDRRLIGEGTSFRRIKDDVRRDLLRYYAQQTGFDFASISERLGFAEQAVMTRKCRTWFALTPTQLRRRGARRLS